MQIRFIFLAILFFSFTSLTFAKEYIFDDNYYNQNNFYENLLTVPGGQIITSRLNSDINSQTNYQNETITTQLMKDWTYYGKVIAPEGSLINGKVTSIQKSSYANGNAKVNISFYQIIRPDNVVITFQAKPICITIGDSRAKSSTKMILEGIKQSVLSSNSVSLENIANNAVTGAISGSFVFLTTKGEEVHIPFGTQFKINIINNLKVTPYEN